MGLPGVENREKILKTLLAKEEVDENLDYKELSMMTEGYTGSDLKVLFIFFQFIPFFFAHFEFILK